MKRDMSTMRHEVESVHHVKEDIDDLRDCIDKLQEQNRRRKMRLLEQVFSLHLTPFPHFTFYFLLCLRGRFQNVFKKIIA